MLLQECYKKLIYNIRYNSLTKRNEIKSLQLKNVWRQYSR